MLAAMNQTTAAERLAQAEARAAEAEARAKAAETREHVLVTFATADVAMEAYVSFRASPAIKDLVASAAKAAGAKDTAAFVRDAVRERVAQVLADEAARGSR